MTTSSFISGTFNAFAFAGAGFLFQKLNRSGYEKEMERHNQAMERLTKARDKWNEARLKELDRLQNLHYQKQVSEKDIQQTNKDFLLVQTKYEETKPILSHFYKPGPEMEEYLNIVKYISTVPILYGVLALL